MNMENITIDPMTLASIGGIVAMLVQAVKRIPYLDNNKGWLPLVSLVVGGLVGFAGSFVLNIDAMQGVISGLTAGLLASGSYDVLKSTGQEIGMVKKPTQ